MVRALSGLLALSSCGGQPLSPDPEGPGRWLLWISRGDVSGAPATNGAVVFFGTKDHEVLAVDPASGAIRWRATTDARTTQTQFGRNIVLAAGNVIFGDYAIYAFDATTGARRWVFDPEAQQLPGYAVGAYALSTDGISVYAGSGSGHVYALRAADGSLAWVNALSPDSNSSVYDPLIDGTRLYVTVRHFTKPITGAVVALDRTNGSVLWSHEFTSDPRAGSGPARQLVTFGTTVIASNDDGKIYALDKETGETKWTAARRPDVIGYDDLRPIVLAGNLVVAGSLTHFITAYDATNGEKVWEADGGQGSAANQLVTDGATVYEPYNNGVLGAFDAKTGARRWLRFAPNNGLFVSYPMISDTLLFAPSTNGLVAIKR
jgi:outer membrane protein assembly factor BamB